ncbi:MAG: hypothetical protein AAGF56_12085 [Pseudomonadota bacterium]
MKALILRSDPDAALATAQVMTKRGFQVMCLQSLTVAHALIRLDTLDVVIMDEVIEGQLTHAIALSAERRNGRLSAIVLTDRPRAETDDLYALVPSLYALVGTDTAADLLGQLAMSAMQNVDDIADAVVVRAAKEAEIAVGETAKEEAEKRTDDAVVATTSDASKGALSPLVLSPELAAEGLPKPQPEVPPVPALPSFLRSASSKQDEPKTVAVSPAAAPEDTFTAKPEPQFARVDDAVLAKVAELFASTPLPTTVRPQRVRRAKAS